MINRLLTSPGLPLLRLPPEASTLATWPIIEIKWTKWAADSRGTKPAPNGTDIPGQCTREFDQLGGSAAN